MSVEQDPGPSDLETLPEFELTYAFDDDEHPDEVTLFPTRNGSDLTTTWITVDLEHAVPLDEVR